MLDRREVLRGVVGIQVSRPGGSQELLAGPAQQIAQRLVHLLQVPLEIQDRHATGGCLESRFQHAFGLPQPSYRPVLLTPEVAGDRSQEAGRHSDGEDHQGAQGRRRHRQRRSGEHQSPEVGAGHHRGRHRRPVRRQHQRVDEGQQAEPHLQGPGHRPGQLTHQQQHRQRQAPPDQRPPLPLRPGEPGDRQEPQHAQDAGARPDPDAGVGRGPDHPGVGGETGHHGRLEARQHPGGKGRNTAWRGQTSG